MNPLHETTHDNSKKFETIKKIVRKLQESVQLLKKTGELRRNSTHILDFFHWTLFIADSKRATHHAGTSAT